MDKIKCKVLFQKQLKLFKILIVKNITQNKTFVFNKERTLKDDWDFMFNIVKDLFVSNSYQINQLSFCIEVESKHSISKSFFKKLFKF